MEIEKILCAAIWYKNQPDTNPVYKVSNIENGVVLCGHRHHSIIGQCVALFNKAQHEMGESEQGFLTSKNRFVGRNEAAKIAQASGQINWKMVDFEQVMLYSEDLY